MFQERDGSGDVYAPLARRRGTKSIATDLAVRRAAVALIHRQGIDAVSFRDVATEARLTHGALYSRFEDVEELISHVWVHELKQRAAAMATLAINATIRPSASSGKDLVAYLRKSSAADAAAVQVLLASRRYPAVRSEVDNFTRDYLASRTSTPGPMESRSLVVFSLMLSVIVTIDQFGPEFVNWTLLELTLSSALLVDPREVSRVALNQPGDSAFVPTGSDLRSLLTFHTVGAVATRGFTKSTISQISRRANYSAGGIYKIYGSKDDLVQEAVREFLKRPWITARDLCAILDDGALAQWLFASGSNDNEALKHFRLEVMLAAVGNRKIGDLVLRQSQNHEVLAACVSGLDSEESTYLRFAIQAVGLLSLGVSFLSTLTADIASIDFNQFAEPLRRSFEEALPSWGKIRSQLLALAA